ncbi:MAG TPA: YraN family protein [Opitutus sp.]|nr:YraN family protein [Opitutus sp.]
MKKDGRGLRRTMWHWLQTFFGIGRGADAGARGEAWAAAWLRRERGFTIVARNWRSPRDRRDELDLVCRDGGVLVFVEVKARAADALVPGFFAVNQRKKRVLRRAIDAYLAQLARVPRTFRLDVVEVAFKAGAGEPEVLHFENVKLFSKYYRG